MCKRQNSTDCMPYGFLCPTLQPLKIIIKKKNVKKKNWSVTETRRGKPGNFILEKEGDSDKKAHDIVQSKLKGSRRTDILTEYQDTFYHSMLEC